MKLGSRRRNLQEESSRRLVTGTRAVLVVRADAADVSTTKSNEGLEDDIFGTGNDAVNLVSQYDACSYGQLQFEAAATPVLTVQISNTVTGANDGTIRQAMEDEANILLGQNVYSFANHVMFCLPRGTVTSSGSSGWIGYANLPGSRSVYNDK